MSGHENRIVDVPRIEMVQTTELGMVRLSTGSGRVESTGGGAGGRGEGDEGAIS